MVQEHIDARPRRQRRQPLLLPVCILIAVVRFNLFDIDRLLSATASYTILAILVLAGALAVVPRVAAATGRLVGMDASAAQFVLSLVLATVVVPVHRRLRPQIERVFFRERYAATPSSAASRISWRSCRRARDPRSSSAWPASGWTPCCVPTRACSTPAPATPSRRRSCAGEPCRRPLPPAAR